MTRTYKHTPAGGGGPMGAGAIPTSMQPRPGLVRVPVRRKGVQQVHEPEPEIEDEVPEDEPPTDEIEEGANGAVYFPQSEQVLAACIVCAATESTDVLVTIAKVNEISVCGSCVERLMEATRAELPRRRMRLALERLGGRDVTPELLETVEKLAGAVRDE